MADITAARNIAYAIPAAEIDREAVGRAARIAPIHEFVNEGLPDGYGERGLRL